jgi:hypothetical protein
MNDVSTLFEPRFVWSTRICAEAAKVALREGKTLKERAEIYEREIAAAVAAREVMYGKECDINDRPRRRTAAQIAEQMVTREI